jgi:hypothetical protein
MNLLTIKPSLKLKILYNNLYLVDKKEQVVQFLAQENLFIKKQIKYTMVKQI